MYSRITYAGHLLVINKRKTPNILCGSVINRAKGQ